MREDSKAFVAAASWRPLVVGLLALAVAGMVQGTEGGASGPNERAGRSISPAGAGSSASADAGSTSHRQTSAEVRSDATSGASSNVCAADRAVAAKAIVSGAALPPAPAEKRLMTPFPYIPTDGNVQRCTDAR